MVVKEGSYIAKSYFDSIANTLTTTFEQDLSDVMSRMSRTYAADDKWVAFDDLLLLLRYAREHEFLSVEIGKMLDLAAHGLLGMAAKGVDTPKDAMLLLVNYLASTTNAFRFEAEESGERFSLHFVPLVDFRGCLPFFIESLTMSFLIMYSELVPGYSISMTVYVQYGKPSYYSKIASEFEPTLFVFNQDINALSAPLEELVRPISLASRQPENLTLVESVTRLLSGSESELLTLDMVANKLNLSPRTLKRRLQKGGTTFSELARSVRLKAAVELLERSTLSIDQIAYRVGYRNASTFNTAFKKWTGQTPGEYRRTQDLERKGQ